MREADQSVYFATSNRGKYAEASLLANKFGVILKHLNIEKLEIQSDRLAEIASYAAQHAASAQRRRVVAEDAGFFVKALNGFPGPFSAYVFQTIGTRGILRLMDGAKNRAAWFEAAVAYCAPGEQPRCFTGSVTGTVSNRERGSHGFGFDPIFLPHAGDRKTFAEMSVEEKNEFSHRAKAFAKFCKWFGSARR